jgi:G3E family GTPase
MNIGIYVLVALVALALVVVKKTIVIIPQSETKIIERLGRYFATLKPGINVIIPFIDHAKGICYFDDERDMCYVFEQAGKQKTVKQAGQWLATMPKDELAQVLMNNPQLQKEWDQELGDRMIKIVFIGQHIKEQKDAIIAELDKCLA